VPAVLPGDNDIDALPSDDVVLTLSGSTPRFVLKLTSFPEIPTLFVVSRRDAVIVALFVPPADMVDGEDHMYSCIILYIMVIVIITNVLL